MTRIKPSMELVTPEVHLRTLETEDESTLSTEKENSQFLDVFLESCKGTAPTEPAPADAVSSNVSNSTILTLPLNIIRKILRNLLTSSNPLILKPDSITTPPEYRTYLDPNVLQVCKLFHNIGIPILYGENTLTASSPATSLNFDTHLLSLPGSKRQMVTSIRLEIDWADQLWAKFPLLARALGELKGLQKLEIVIVEEGTMTEQEKRTASIDKDANLGIVISYDPISPSKDRTARQCAPATDRADENVKRVGPVADLMLKAEMKMLKDLVTGLKGLKEFRLRGFRHEVFAWCLEEHVRIGNC